MGAQRFNAGYWLTAFNYALHHRLLVALLEGILYPKTYAPTLHSRLGGHALRLLVALLEGILYPKTYAPNLDGCHVEMGVLGRLLDEKAPKLSKHLKVIITF